jgi:uncharacterized membrane protein YeaQ/YmgE (transglycosylase-associated protein family)
MDRAAAHGLRRKQEKAAVSPLASGKRRPRSWRADAREGGMAIVWIILIGFVAGIIARLISPAPNNPSGFILTTVLGIAGAFVATFIGQTIGWYRLDQGAGLIGATVGAIIVLFVWRQIVASRSS